MKMSDRLAQSEKQIRELLDRYGDLPREIQEYVCSFLDAGENALALDMLGDYVVENELPVSRAFVDDMAKVYGFMGVTKPRNIAFLKARTASG
jgi:hypothetical protein